MPIKEREDLTGRVFGELTVLHESNVRYRWVCECSCGKLTQVLGSHLRRGLTKSCGHLQRQHVQQIAENWAKSVAIDKEQTPSRRRMALRKYGKQRFG